MDDVEYTYLKARMKDLSGIDLSDYGERQMRRRLSGFVSRTPSPSIASYCRMLEKDSLKLRELVAYLTIKVTEFFRDPATFEQLEALIQSRLAAKGRHLNVWCAGCSSGCEAYSVALVLKRVCPDQCHRIVATDVDEVALCKARDGGPYRPAEVRHVPQAILEKYFTCAGRSYWICDGLRQAVDFRRHDLLSDPFDSGFDLIVCRNVTIYFTEQARKRLNQRLHQSLTTGGILFIGATESIFDAAQMGFTRLDHGFYAKASKEALGSMRADRRDIPMETSRGKRNAADICTVC
jgi:chemotaxis protein methyltransferase CheR